MGSAFFERNGKRDKMGGMKKILLSTKYYLPTPRSDLAGRSRLIQRLEAVLRPGCKLLLVCAPAGFGKTTLVTDWLNQRDGQDFSCAWLSVDEGDNDPVQFFSYLVAALGVVDHSLEEAIAPLLQSAQPLPFQEIATLLINDLHRLTRPVLLVLDDYHLITATAVHQILRFIVERQPALLRLAILTREDPPLPWPQLRARGQVVELRQRDLRFTEEEAAVFLQQTMGVQLSTEAVAALAGRTEGWIAGLQLAALALQENPHDAERFITTFTGSDRYVMDYLITEVLDRQPEDVRDFLYRTSILDCLSGSLCDALTGWDNGQRMLERLEGANLFLIPLDHRREWYRYHALFAEFLRTALPEAERQILHGRAALWYENSGLVNQAVEQALIAAGLSGRWDAAVRLILVNVEAVVLGGGMMTVSRWLDRLPEAVVQSEGELLLYRGWILAFTGDQVAAEAYVAAAKLALVGQPEAESWGRWWVLRSFLDLSRRNYTAVALATGEAMQRLAGKPSSWMTMALWAQAEAQERMNHLVEALETFRQARQVGRVLGDTIFTMMVEMSLGLVLNELGRRREAVALCWEVIERIREGPHSFSMAGDFMYSRLGTFFYESNELELSNEYHRRAITAMGRLWEHDRIFSRALAAPTWHALGQTTAALAALRAAFRIAQQAGYTDANWCLVDEANIRLQYEELESVLRWGGSLGLISECRQETDSLPRQLLCCRLWLLQGRIAEAQSRLVELAAFMKEHGIGRWLLTTRILQALAAERSGDRAGARGLLTEAVQIAAPEGYIRAFLDEDPRLIALLPEVRAAAPEFVDQLLAAAGVACLHPVAASQALVDPLSERELEVLMLVAAGLSNPEIAQRLFISVGTVKRHINHIYGKLEVGSRTEAVAKARNLKLI